MTDIPIIVYEIAKGRDKRKMAGGSKRPGETDVSVHNIPAETLRSNFEGVVKALASSLTIPESIGSFEV
jgi:hypothetical protein